MMYLFGFGLVWNVFDWIVYCVNTFAKNYKDLDRLTHTKLVLIKINHVIFSTTSNT